MSISLGHQPLRASCNLIDTRSKLVGRVKFIENLKFWQTRIEIEVWDQKPGEHGIHIHEVDPVLPDYYYLTDNPGPVPCDLLGGHYDPYFTGVHGNHTDNIVRRHVGDMGNILVDYNGTGRKVFWDSLIKLRGPYSVIGKTVVLHSDRDDLGRGQNANSLKNGNSGARVACGYIKLV